MPWYRRSHWRILIALVLGLVYGVVAAYAGWGAFTADWIAPFGTIFLRLLLLVAVPLVLASLITGIASLSDLNKLSRIGGKTIAIYLGTTLICNAGNASPGRRGIGARGAGEYRRWRNCPRCSPPQKRRRHQRVAEVAQSSLRSGLTGPARSGHAGLFCFALAEP